MASYAGLLIGKVSCVQSPSCPSVLAATDFAVFVFDSTSLASFRTAHQLMLAVAQAAGDALPCVFLAAKDDLGMSQVPCSFRQLCYVAGAVQVRPTVSCRRCHAGCATPRPCKNVQP